MKGFKKVPFRDVYCDTWSSWFKQTIWCHLVIRLFPNTIDLDTVPEYLLNDRQAFLYQFDFMFRRALGDSTGFMEPKKTP